MTNKCWQCGVKVTLGDMFCPSCGAILPSVQIDHFTRMGVARNFEIGEKNLDVAYFALQRSLHPDLFARKSAKEQKYSMAHTVDVNAAYETLKSPLKRAEYLLQLEGIIVNQDNSDSVRPSQQILMETLEIREELENADSNEDIRKITIQANEDRMESIDKIKLLLQQRNLDDAAQETIRLRYLEKLIYEARNKN